MIPLERWNVGTPIYQVLSAGKIQVWISNPFLYPL
jgi:hypothetical protein